MHFFFETLNRFLVAEKGALDNMSLLLRRYSDVQFTNVAGANSDVEKQDINPAKLLPNNSTTAAAVEEAVALGLPQEVGQWRQVQKIWLNQQKANCQISKVWNHVSLQLTACTTNLVKKTTSLLHSEGYHTNSTSTTEDDTLSSFLPKQEGPKISANWNQAVVQTCIVSCQSAQTLAKLQHVQLPKQFVVKQMEKQLKNYTEAEETRWKHVCDAAKVAMKTHQKLESIKADLLKAKERLNTTTTITNNDHNNNNSNNSNSNNNPVVINKALGNMFSMLGGGEEVLMKKMLTPDQRMAVARTSVQNLQTKQNKEQTLLDQATKEKEVAIQAYVGTCQSCYLQNKSEQYEFDSSLKNSCSQTIEAHQDFQKTKFDVNSSAMQYLQQISQKQLSTDFTEWTQQQQSQLLQLKTSNSKQQGEFQLQLQLFQPNTIYQLFQQQQSDTTNAGISESGKSENSHDSQPQDSLKPNHDGIVIENGTPTTGTHKSYLNTSTSNDNNNNSVGLTSPARKRSSSNMENKQQQKSSSSVNVIQTSVFLAHFWDQDSSETPPTVIDSFSCAYWPKEEEGHFSPLLHGRMFCTSTNMYFVGWGDKKIVLPWETVISISKETTAYGTVPNALLITHDNGSYFFGSFAFRDNALELLNRLSTIARSIKDVTTTPTTSKNLKKVPPDEGLKKMQIVLSKKIPNMSISKFYTLCWSESEEHAFYKPFLQNDGCFDIIFPEWQHDDQFFHSFSDETYTQKRVSTVPI